MIGDGKRRPMVAAGGKERDKGRRIDQNTERSAERDQGGRGRITAFYMETLVLAVVFVMVIVVLAKMFSLSVRMSDDAKALTCAVRLAENAAEAVAASKSADDLVLLLDENGNAGIGESGCIYAAYDRSMNPEPEGIFRLEVTWEPQADGCVKSAITVFREGESEPVYALTTAVYVEEGKCEAFFKMPSEDMSVSLASGRYRKGAAP